jgi:hypothetical protein
MYYYWWLVAMALYLGILVLYGVISAIVANPSQRTNGDAVFFAIASVVTLSVVPLLKENLYSV